MNTYSLVFSLVFGLFVMNDQLSFGQLNGVIPVMTLHSEASNSRSNSVNFFEKNYEFDQELQNLMCKIENTGIIGSSPQTEPITCEIRGYNDSGAELFPVVSAGWTGSRLFRVTDHQIKLSPGSVVPMSIYFEEPVNRLVLRIYDVELSGIKLASFFSGEDSDVIENPKLPGCVDNIGILLDVSSSLRDEEYRQVCIELSSWINQYLKKQDQQQSTNSEVNIIAFNERIVYQRKYQLGVDQSDVADLYIDRGGLYEDQKTDWSLALNTVVPNKYDLVLLITDAPPDIEGQAHEGRLNALSSAMEAANSLKKAGSRITAIGIDQIQHRNASHWFKLITSGNQSINFNLNKSTSKQFWQAEYDYITVEDVQLLKNGFSNMFVACDDKKVESSSNLIQVSPNPTRDQLQIEIKRNEEDSEIDYAYVLGSSFGQSVMRGTITNVSQRISISDLIPGVYYLSIFDGEQSRLFSEKIIIIE